MSTRTKSENWFYKIENAKRGPVSATELRGKILNQELPVETSVWRDGMETWMPARHAGDLFPDGFIPIYNAQSQTSAHGDATPALQRFAKEKPVMFWAGTLLVFATMVQLIWSIVAVLFVGSTYGGPALLKVAGRVVYEDGMAIPAPSIVLSFVPLDPSGEKATNGRTGVVVVDSETGKFASVLACRNSSTELPKYKVCVLAEPQVPLSENLLRAEYAKSTTTPLEVDVTQIPLELRVARPAKTPR
jgi:hypothetical protein